jgi:hypothetical protein
MQFALIYAGLQPLGGWLGEGSYVAVLPNKLADSYVLEKPLTQLDASISVSKNASFAPVFLL